MNGGFQWIDAPQSLSMFVFLVDSLFHRSSFIATIEPLPSSLSLRSNMRWGRYGSWEGEAPEAEAVAEPDNTQS